MSIYSKYTTQRCMTIVYEVHCNESSFSPIGSQVPSGSNFKVFNHFWRKFVDVSFRALYAMLSIVSLNHTSFIHSLNKLEIPLMVFPFPPRVLWWDNFMLTQLNITTKAFYYQALVCSTPLFLIHYTFLKIAKKC